MDTRTERSEKIDNLRAVVLYDIASGPPATCFAPNPWKARYSLNIKEVDYRTQWIELPDVTSTRKLLNIPANRKLPSGDDFHTLPIIHDLSNDTLVGDSFEIALYLDKAYRDNGSPTLIPSGTTGLHTAFNAQVDHLFTSHLQLFIHGMPLNPATADQSRATFVERAQATNWDSLGVRGEERTALLQRFNEALEAFAKVYRFRQGEGPFLEGDQITYADVIVGSWLQYVKACSSKDEWEEILKWQNGLWGKLHLGLDRYAQVK